MDIFERTAQLLGEDSLEKLKKAHVAVFGIGGVGGMAVEALARTGVGNLTVIDGDSVSLSNINRQIIANTNNVGKAKTEVLLNRLKSINPQVNVTAINTFYLPNNADEIDFSKFDYVIDAVDTVTAKLEIIVRAKQANIPVISCMGTGGKSDISALKVVDVYKTENCPLAKIMRKELRERKVTSLKTVFSSETGVKGKREDNEKIIPSTIFVPATAGLMMASEVIQDLIK